MNKFIKKNKNEKIVVLDIPLFLENKINKKKDILIFVNSSKKEINKRLKKRLNVNLKIVGKFKKLQLPVEFKKKKSDFIIKNNFKNKFVKKLKKLQLSIETKKKKSDFVIKNNFKNKFLKKNVKKVIKKILLNA